MVSLPIELWGKILIHLNSTQRIQVCKLLINSGSIKIESTLFHTYMNLLAESTEIEHQDIFPFEDSPYNTFD